MSIELQNAFELSRREWNREEDPRIAAALERGLFVVVFTDEVCCPRTDAVMGDQDTFVDGFATREAADDHARLLNEEEGGRCRVRPFA
jgi:hypothetical protein